MTKKRRARQRERRPSLRLQFESLESRHLLAANPIITEFQASNDGTLLDGNGNSSDWIEIYNAGDQPINLLGFTLSDDPTNSDKFVLPTKTLLAGEHWVVFASGDNAPDADGNIHTSFKLSVDGEHIGLYDPVGNVVSEFGTGGTDYPLQLEDVSYGLNFDNGAYVLGSSRYLIQPSPGGNNTPNAGDLAPIVTEVSRPALAIQGQDLLITAKPVAVGNSISSVTMSAVVNFGTINQIAMLDNGSGADATAGDGIYSAWIPSSSFDEGDMVRWSVSANSTAGLTGKAPTYLSILKSPRYFGTVVADSAINTQLPVFQWFTNNVSAAIGNGARASVYYNGEFYDNVLVRKRGQSSNNSPKKNLKFDFNPGDRFLLEPGMLRVDEVNVSNTYYDQADIRATLSHKVFAAIGQPSPISFPMHTRLNGEFYSLAIYIEQVDAEFLERNGWDPNGALYKADGGSAGNNGFNPIHGLTGFLKRTRLDEGNSDLQALANAVSEHLPQSDRAEFLYDNVDIFSVINYLAGTSIIHNADHLGKNHYVYQDTEGTGKWSFIPWDLDLTFGKNGASTPNTEVYQAAITDQSSSAYPNSHPLFGGSEYTRFSNSDLYNRLVDAVYDTPELRELFLRRLRTVMDTILQSPDTAAGDLILDARVVELLNDIQADWTADDAKWIEAPQTDRDRGTDWGEDLPLATHMQRIIDRYLAPRRNHLYNTHNIANVGVAYPLVETTDAFRYHEPTSEIAGWQTPGFADSGWSLGDQGIGYDFNNGYDSLLGTDLDPPTNDRTKNVYTRMHFNVASQQEIDSIEDLNLDIRFDDGFIAYLNGVEVARDAGTNGSGITASTGSHEASGPERFPLSAAAIASLNVGDNVLAVHGINANTTSSDLLLQYSLTGSSGGDPEAAGIPDAQIGNPTITFDAADFDANPVSGIQGQEYLRLNNPTGTAVDISGWKLSGGVDLTFRPGTVIPAGGQLYAVADVLEFLDRTTGPSGGQNLLTHGNYSGQLSIAGETIQLVADDGQLMDTLVIAPTTGNDLQQFLRVTEINYHPNSVSGAEEFIEFTNISAGGNSVTLDLSGASITDGPSTPFVFPTGTILGPGARLVVVKDTSAFIQRYGTVPSAQIFGPFSGSLSNGGERLRVSDSGGNTVMDVRYGDSDEWAVAADGAGATLVLDDPSNTPFNELGKHYRWRSSAVDGGTPGAADPPLAGVVINEILAHTDLPNVDSIELFNTNTNPITIGGWWLSDDVNNLQKFQIPAATFLFAGDFVAFDESDFNPTPATPAANHFSLSSAGESLFLTRPNIVNGVEFVDAVNFGATYNGQSLGLVPDGVGRVAPLAALTLGSANSGHEISDLVISEVNYHPATPSPAAQSAFQMSSAGTLLDRDLEFVEIHNPTTAGVDLTSWRLRGESDFEFTAGETLQPGDSLVVVTFDPATDLARLTAFQTEYGLTGATTIVGPLSQDLSNNVGRVELQSPDVDALGTTYVTADEVLYDDLAPWPIAADGLGSSLERVGPSAFGNASGSWAGATPTPGSADFVPQWPCDYVGFGNGCDIADINALYAGTNGAPTPLSDGLIIQWLADASVTTNPAKTNSADVYRIGDVDLSGDVDSTDLGFLLNNFGDTSGAGWGHGNTNSDSDIDSTDLGSLLNNFGFSSYVLAATSAAAPTVAAADSTAVEGESKNRHKLTFDVDGPTVNESEAVNRFLDYRLDDTFAHPIFGKQYVVPGLFAADEDAENLHATSGVHFTPDEIGVWAYQASFRTGTNVTVASSSMAGVALQRPIAGRAARGISDGLTRLFVGLEDLDDLYADLDQAIRSATA